MARAKMGSSAGWNGNYVESATASFSLVPGDSGKVFILKDGAITVTLPALSDIDAGYQVTLISGGASNHILNGGASLIYGYAINETTTTDGAEVTRLAGVSSATLAGGATGDKYDIISDGTNWYVYAISDAAVS
jgi:hypothetical protein